MTGGTEAEPTIAAVYCAVVVTFKRPTELVRTLTSVLTQSVPPAFVVVADNDPCGSAAEAVGSRTWDRPVELLSLRENGGPAGGWAAAMAAAATRADRGHWVLVVDDDDPLGHPALVEHLLAAGTTPRLAGIGLRGARLSRPLALLHRVSAPRGVLAEVDYLAGNGAPLYRWAALDAVGGFDGELFFGFEDLDLGLRLKAHGWTLGAVTLDHLHVVADTAPARVAWREYYKTRALVVIARRHLGALATLSTIVRAGVLGAARLIPREGGWRIGVARVHGVIDAMAGRMGARVRYLPASNPAKQALPADLVG